jgi:hypothetical protein
MTGKGGSTRRVNHDIGRANPTVTAGTISRCEFLENLQIENDLSNANFPAWFCFHTSKVPSSL